jgi:lysophospholipase L1-like esterase
VAETSVPRAYGSSAGTARGLAVRLLTLAVALSVAAAILEVGLRIAGYAPAALALYRPNPEGGGSFRLRPNLSLATRMGGDSVPITTNAHGMRWRETPLAPAAESARVALVGDSFTFGLWSASVESSLAGVLDQNLRPRGFEVLNFGVPGFGLLDIELQIRQQVLAFSPRYIILASYMGNDLLDTYLGLHRYDVRRDGTLQLNRGNLRERIPVEHLDGTWSIGEVLRRHIRLYAFAAQLRKDWRRGSNDAASGRIATTEGYTSNVFWSRRDYPPFAEAALRASLEAIARIKKLCDERGIQLLFVSIPSLEQVYTPHFFSGRYDIGLPQRHFEAFARSAAIPYLDLAPALVHEARTQRRNLHIQSDGHFNTAGHQVSGARISEFFLQMARQP